MNNEIDKSVKDDFGDVLSIIEQAQENLFHAANREFISIYWNIGKFVSKKVRGAGWGKSIVKEFSIFIQSHYVGIQ